jgi:Ca2+-binding RTX toxin-like protein
MTSRPLEGGVALLLDAGISGIRGELFDNLGVRNAAFTAKGSNGSITELNTGDLLIASEVSGVIHYQKIRITGVTMRTFSELPFGTQVNPRVVARAIGGFASFIELDQGEEESDLLLRIDDERSTASRFYFDYNIAPAYGISVALMTNGNMAVAFTKNNGTDTEIWIAVISPYGAEIVAPIVLDNTGSVNRNVSLAATASGFVVAYEGGPDGDIGIQVQSLGFDGAYIANTTIGGLGDDLNPEIIALPDGMLGVIYEYNGPVDTDLSFVLLDSGLAQIDVVGITGGAAIADDMQNAAMAHFGFGRVGVVAENLTTGKTNRETVAMVFNSIGDGDGDNALGSGAYENFMQGNGGNDTLKGNLLTDTIEGGAGDDSLVGGAGSDSLDGGTGNDLMQGESDDDSYFVDSIGDIVTELAGGGIADTVLMTLNTYTLPSQVERGIFAGTGNFVGLGNSIANRLNGNSGADRFVDVAGGNDTISGGTGSDSMDFRSSTMGAIINLATGSHGGAAAGDVYVSIEKFFGSNTADDTMTAGGGRASFSGFGGNDTLTGGSNIDALQGNGGNDLLNGQGGVDSLAGGAGNDTLTGGTEKDYFIYSAAGFGQDIITDFHDGLDKLKVHSSVANNISAFSITNNGTTSVVLTQISSPTNTITLQSASALTITATDFVFY